LYVQLLHSRLRRPPFIFQNAFTEAFFAEGLTR
jgi:hypothetical protein